jgi:hypothetical protein
VADEDDRFTDPLKERGDVRGVAAELAKGVRRADRGVALTTQRAD